MVPTVVSEFAAEPRDPFTFRPHRRHCGSRRRRHHRRGGPLPDGVIGNLTAAGFAHGIGPGVWDIHSPRVPDVGEIAESLSLTVSVVGPSRLWVNPDCGLKTRGYAETEAALRNIVQAARQARAQVA